MMTDVGDAAANRLGAAAGGNFRPAGRAGGTGAAFPCESRVVSTGYGSEGVVHQE